MSYITHIGTTTEPSRPYSRPDIRPRTTRRRDTYRLTSAPTPQMSTTTNVYHVTNRPYVNRTRNNNTAKKRRPGAFNQKFIRWSHMHTNWTRCNADCTG